MNVHFDWYSLYTGNSCNKTKYEKTIGNISFDNLSTKNRLVFQKLEKVLCSVVCFLLVCIDQSTILSAGSVCVEKM